MTHDEALSILAEKLEKCEELLDIIKRNAEIIENNQDAPIFITIIKSASLDDWVIMREWLINEKIKRA